LHCPARWRSEPGSPNRYRWWVLPTAAPCGARTFLPPQGGMRDSESDEGRGIRDERSANLSSFHPSSFIPHPFISESLIPSQRRRPSSRPTNPNSHRISKTRFGEETHTTIGSSSRRQCLTVFLVRCNNFVRIKTFCLESGQHSVYRLGEFPL
jgi:hypothetical protein